MRISPNLLSKSAVYKPVSGFRLVGGIAAMSFPVGYMISQHIKWMPTREQKIKMAMKHTGFWGGMIASLLTVHHLGFWAPRGRVLQPMLAFLAAAVYPVLGYLAMVQLSRAIFRKKHQDTSQIQQAQPPVVKETVPVNPQKILQNVLTQTTLPAGYPLFSPNQSTYYPYQYPYYQQSYQYQGQ